MKKLPYLIIFLMLASVQGCVKEPDGSKYIPGDRTRYYDFTTMAEVTLTVDYHIDHMIDFAVYSQNPCLVGGEESARKFKPGIRPLFRAITDAKGCFTGKMKLPATVDKVWIYTKYFGVPTLVELNVSSLGVTFDNVLKNPRSRNGYNTAPAGIDVMAEWDDYGVPSDLETGRATIPARLFHNLIYTLPNGVNINAAHGDLLGNSGSLALGDSSKIELVLAHDGSAMANSVGYYWYKTSDGFDASTVQKVLALPNASFAGDGGNLLVGDRVKLRFQNPATSLWGDKFPGGYTVGFFMISNGFDDANKSVQTKPEFGVYYTDYAAGRQQSILVQDPATFTEGDVFILAWEEWPLSSAAAWQDNDYNDLILLLKTTKDAAAPAKAIEVDPAEDPKPDYTENILVYEGTLIFDDSWPGTADYDMNNVVIQYKCTMMRDINNNVMGMVDTFRPRWSGTDRHNAFGFQFDNIAQTSNGNTIKVAIGSNGGKAQDKGYFSKTGNGLEAEQTKAVVMVLEDMKLLTPDYKLYTLDSENGVNAGRKPQNAPKYFFRVVTTFSGVDSLHRHPAMSKVGFPPYNPFIVTVAADEEEYNAELSNDYRRRREIHMPYYLPTQLATKLGISQWYEDRTWSSLGYYYVSKIGYTWGINIPVAKFNFPAEGKRMDDSQYGYPRFGDWMESRGQFNKDWYNHPGPEIGALE